jgi:hypothetical protein
MVQALLSGSKTMTRRTKGLENLGNHYFQSLILHATGKFTFVENGNYSPSKEDVFIAKFPYGQEGDVLWVRETFQKRSEKSIQMGIEKYYHKAGWEGCTDGGWKPNIHMPKEACRMFFEITNLRVERLFDITEADAIAEGVEKDSAGWYKNYLGADICGRDFKCASARESFKELWQSINGEDSWYNNPWVWVIEFKKVGMPTGFNGNSI